MMSGRPWSAVHWSGVAWRVRVIAFTSAPCSMRYSHVSDRPLIAAQCSAVMSYSSWSVGRARPESIRARMHSIFPSLAAVNISSCMHFKSYG